MSEPPVRHSPIQSRKILGLLDKGRHRASAGPLEPGRPGVLAPWIWPLLLPAIALLAWQAAGLYRLIDPVLLPTPSEVLSELYTLVSSGELTDHLLISFRRVLVGFAWGSVTAVVLGGLTGYSAFWRSLVDPTVHALRTIPGLAWLPMFILWIGIDEGSKTALIGLAAFFPTYMNVMAGVVRVDRKLIEVGKVYRLSGRKLILKILFPASLPYLFVGLRQSLGIAWIVVVAAELMGASSGIGYLLMNGEMTGRPQIVMACMIIFAICGKATDLAIVLVSRAVLRWQDTVAKE